MGFAFALPILRYCETKSAENPANFWPHRWGTREPLPRDAAQEGGAGIWDSAV